MQRSIPSNAVSVYNTVNPAVNSRKTQAGIDIKAAELANKAEREKADKQIAKDYKNAENSAWVTYVGATIFAEAKYFATYTCGSSPSSSHETFSA